MRIQSTLLLGAAALFMTAAFSTNAQAACETSEHRQFDFWLGEWQVYRPDGSVAGSNTIKRAMAGCVLHERYQAPTGYEGESFSMYDGTQQRWHQTWVDSDGLLLILVGGLKDKTMVLEGDSRDGNGVITHHRVSWITNADGSIRQLWQSQSPDSPWQTVFDGLYRVRAVQRPEDAHAGK
jgi:hypothetical protein